MNGKRKTGLGTFGIFLLLSPALAVIGGLFVGGLIIAASQSLGYYGPIGENGFTVSHYVKLLNDEEFRASLQLTISTTFIATVLSALMGTGLALGLRKMAARSGLLNTLLQIPLALPHLAMAVVLINFLSPSGLIARILFHLDFIDTPGEFPAFISDRYAIGIILAYVLKETPFIALMVLTLLARIGTEYEEVAGTLGASSLQRLWYITLPLIAPAIVSSSVVVFSFIFGAFEVPFILGRPYPAMLSVIAQRRFMDVDLSERPDSIAVAMIIAIMTALLAWLNLRLTRKLIGVERATIF